MSYRGDIKRLATEFEEEDYKFQVDLLSQGYRLRVLTSGRGSIDGYINVLHSYPGYRTSRGHISVNVTIVESLKRNNPESHRRLMGMHAKTIEFQSDKSGYKPIHKSMYSYQMIRDIIKSIKSDYFKDYPREKRNQNSSLLDKESVLGRTTSEKSIKRNLDKGYTADWWPFVQDEARVNAEMKCQCCGVAFKIDTAYECSLTKLRFKDCFPLYHVHHKDRNTKNNNPTNLEALCLTCHSFEAGTGHEKFRTGQIKYRGSFPEYVSNILHHRILNQMRRQQGIDITFDIDFETLQRKQKIETVVSDKAQKVIQRQSGIIEKQEGLIERLISLIKRTVA